MTANKKLNILVSGASGVLGYGILRCLDREKYHLIGTTIYDESPAECFADEVLNPPVTVDENYIPWLIKTIKEKSIDIIFPGIEIDMEVWNKHREEIGATGCFVVLNNPELVELCLDKWEFYKKLEDADVECRIPTTNVADFSAFPKPFIVKPRKGFGSKGFQIIESKEQFNAVKDCIGNDLIMQEKVGTAEQEYTVSAFFDYYSNIRALISQKRRLSRMGYTEIGEVVDIDYEIRPVISELAALFKPVGPTDFQFRKTDRGWKLLEINPRISASTSIRKAFGYNEAQMCIDYFLDNKEIIQPQIRYGKAIRYIEDYIVR